MAQEYGTLALKLADGRERRIRVEPVFRAEDLQFHRFRRAVTLGNLTVLYNGIVYDVRAEAARCAAQP